MRTVVGVVSFAVASAMAFTLTFGEDPLSLFTPPAATTIADVAEAMPAQHEVVQLSSFTGALSLVEASMSAVLELRTDNRRRLPAWRPVAT